MNATSDTPHSRPCRVRVRVKGGWGWSSLPRGSSAVRAYLFIYLLSRLVGQMLLYRPIYLYVCVVPFSGTTA